MSAITETQQGIVRTQYRISIRKEIIRKSIHICSAFVPALLYRWYWPVLALLVAALCAYTVSELLRLQGIEVPVIARLTEVASRKRDENHFVGGPVTLTLGILAAALLWRPDCARIGIYALAFGDGLASLGGKMFGRVNIPFTKGKTAAGSLTCFTAVFISSYTVCQNTRASLILACAAMVIEVFPMADLDNLVIPVAVGGLSQLLLP